MSELVFHKCRLCGCIFYHKSKDTYCAKCVPSFPHGGCSYEAQKRVYDILSNPERLERRRALKKLRSLVLGISVFIACRLLASRSLKGECENWNIR